MKDSNPERIRKIFQKTDTKKTLIQGTVEITTLSPGRFYASLMRDRTVIVTSPCRFKLVLTVYGLTYEIQKQHKVRTRNDHATY